MNVFVVSKLSSILYLLILNEKSTVVQLLQIKLTGLLISEKLI